MKQAPHINNKKKHPTEIFLAMLGATEMQLLLFEYNWGLAGGLMGIAGYGTGLTQVRRGMGLTLVQRTFS